ncbi:MAG: hypothetical protein ACI4QH_01555 [Candidatus Fimimonas sp.]
MKSSFLAIIFAQNHNFNNQCTIRAINDLQRPVYQMWHEGGLLVENGVVTMLGNVQKIEK